MDSVSVRCKGAGGSVPGTALWSVAGFCLGGHRMVVCLNQCWALFLGQNLDF
jgi:hypothetical protein